MRSLIVAEYFVIDVHLHSVIVAYYSVIVADNSVVVADYSVKHKTRLFDLFNMTV